MIKNYLFKLKKNINRIKWKSYNYISFIALIISLITFYYQFFNVKHEVLFLHFTPSFDNNTDSLFVPIFFKNTGNQTEVILDGNLIMEVKTEENNNYYKRIGDIN